ncbi:MAG: translation initiation factor IF-2 subunit beta [Nanobdellota archaeon]
MNYDEMLKRARNNLPESAKIRERFEIPKVRGHVEGNKTIISNFQQICQTLNRDPKAVWRFVLKELASPGVMEKNRVIFGRKLSSEMINKKIRKFADLYVICPECGKPETKIEKEGNNSYLRCMACGAKTQVKGWLN